MSPADLASLRQLLAARWPDVARSHGLREGQGHGLRLWTRPHGIKLHVGSMLPVECRALHTMADVLEDGGWVVHRFGEDIYVTGREPADMSDEERRARLEKRIADRADRRMQWAHGSADAAREHGARVATMTRRSRY